VEERNSSGRTVANSGRAIPADCKPNTKMENKKGFKISNTRGVVPSEGKEDLDEHRYRRGESSQETKSANVID